MLRLQRPVNRAAIRRRGRWPWLSDSRRLAAEGYTVLVPNAFYRSASLDGSTSPGILTAGQTTERLARWLLNAHDRTDGDAFPMTHDFLSSMLTVSRPAASSVTTYWQPGFTRQRATPR